MNIPIYSVYILKCCDGTHYTGYSKNLDKRFKAHNGGKVKYTRNKLPLELVHVSLFSDKQKAYDFERYLKSGSGKAFRNKRLIVI